METRSPSPAGKRHRVSAPTMQDYWFRRKSFGWGWEPASREGWIVTVGMIAVILFLAYRAEQSSDAGTVAAVYVPLIFGAVLALLLIAWRTSTPQR